MKVRLLCIALLSIFVLLVGGCGGSSDGGSSTGTVSMSVTDAKPMIPGNPTEVWITFAEVRAHKSGGGWVTLPLPQAPLSINLLAFQNGNTTDLVPAVTLDSGKYTQLRFEIQRAWMVIQNGSVQEIELDVPSGFLRTDKNFTFDVPNGGAVNLTVDFDLSQSIVVTGSSKYKLKPVLHLVETRQAATIQGAIAAATFENWSTTEAVVTVIRDTDGSGSVTLGDEEYTKAIVTEIETDPTTFQIFWVVPEENYIVQIDLDGDGLPEYEEFVPTENYPERTQPLQPGEIFMLNKGVPISLA